MTLRTRAITLIAVTVLGGVVLFALSAFAVVRSGYRLGRAAVTDRLEAAGGIVEGVLVRLRRAAEPLASSVNAVAFARGQPEGDGFLARIGRLRLRTLRRRRPGRPGRSGGVVHQVADDELPPSLLTAARDPVLRIPSSMTRTAEGLLVATSTRTGLDGGSAWYEAGGPGAIFGVRFPLVAEPEPATPVS